MANLRKILTSSSSSPSNSNTKPTDQEKDARSCLSSSTSTISTPTDTAEPRLGSTTPTGTPPRNQLQPIIATDATASTTQPRPETHPENLDLRPISQGRLGNVDTSPRRRSREKTTESSAKRLMVKLTPASFSPSRGSTTKAEAGESEKEKDKRPTSRGKPKAEATADPSRRTSPATPASRLQSSLASDLPRRASMDSADTATKGGKEPARSPRRRSEEISRSEGSMDLRKAEEELRRELDALDGNYAPISDPGLDDPEDEAVAFDLSPIAGSPPPGTLTADPPGPINVRNAQPVRPLRLGAARNGGDKVAGNAATKDEAAGAKAAGKSVAKGGGGDGTGEVRVFPTPHSRGQIVYGGMQLWGWRRWQCCKCGAQTHWEQGVCSNLECVKRRCGWCDGIER